VARDEGARREVTRKSRSWLNIGLGNFTYLEKDKRKEMVMNASVGPLLKA